MSILKVYKRIVAGNIGKVLYYMHSLPFPSCKLPNHEDALKILRDTGYDFPPLWKGLAKTYATIPKILYHKTSHPNNAAEKLWKMGAIKSIDQYWLPINLKYQKEELEIPINDGQYLNLLEQYSSSLWIRTHKINTSIFKSLFVLASDNVIQLVIHLKSLIKNIRQLKKH